MYVRMHNELATKLGSQINTIVCLQFSSANRPFSHKEKNVCYL